MAKRKKKAKRDSKPASAPSEVQFRPLQGALSELRDKLKERPTAAERQPAERRPVEPEQTKARSNQKRTYDERMALQRAYQGVKPLEAGVQGRDGKVIARPIPAAHVDGAAQEQALRPVHRLVADGVRFVVDEDEAGHLKAHRTSRGKQALDPLKNGNAQAEATVDLHGFREEPARQMLQRWLRAERSRGRRIVRVVHGQGHHSAGGAVLRDAVRSELERGICAAFVDAFMTASPKQGGQGALLVALRRR